MQHDMQGSADTGGQHRKGHYGKLIAMVGLSFVAMYVLMYAMVDSISNVYNSLNQVYMAGLMAVPMLWIELALMSSMYPDRKRNAGLVVAGIALMLACWIGIRQQAAISDQQFLRSMIPHHAGAVLMCSKNHLKDGDLQQLCRQIIRSQQSEIEQMKSKLR